jgi:hypothetical protein
MAIPQACKCKPGVAILPKDAYMNRQRTLDVALLVLFSINVQGRRLIARNDSLKRTILQ